MQPTKLGETKYYSRAVNGQQTYAAIPYAGNDPYDYTPISRDQYAAGLQGQIASGAKAANGAPSLDQQLSDVRSGTGMHAPGYIDPAFSKFQSNAPTPSSDYLNPDAKAQYDQSLSQFNQQKTAAANNPAYQTASTPEQQMADKYNQIHQQLQENGTQAPASPGAGSAAVSGATPPPPPPGPNTGAITTALTGNSGIDSWMQNFQQAFSSQQQQTTLAQDYQTMTQQLGIPALNTQLMDMKNVMDGTEDDIRNEVTKAGGFATESQVQALTAARNKTLIKNYNNLLDQKNLLQDQVSTMIGLEEKDRTAAHQQLMDQFQIGTKLMDMQQSMQKNAQDSMFNNIKQFGAKAVYDAAVASGDPTAVQRINSMMGPGFDIATMAKTPDLATQKAQLEIQGLKLDNQKKVNDLNASSVANDQPIDPTSHSILAQTGLSVPAFNFLTQGTTALTRMTAAQRQQYMNEAQKFLNTNGVDISTFQSRYKAYNDVLQKNIERANNTQIFGQEVSGTVDQFVQDVGKDFGNLKVKNVAKLFAGGQFNDPTVQKYAFNLQTMQNDLAGYYAASRGASSPSDADMRDAAKVITNGLNAKSATAFKDSINTNEGKVTGVVNRAADTANKAVWDLFGVGGNYKSPNTPTAPSAAPPKLLSPTDIPSGYYQASDGLLYKK